MWKGKKHLLYNTKVGSLLPFPSRVKQQYKQSHPHDEDNGFVLIEIMEKGVAVLVSIIPQGDEDTIPECNSDCGKDGISRKRLLGRTGDKSDVCAAKWDYAGEADCDFPVVAKSTVGGKDGLFGRRKSAHQSVEKWGATEASNQIGEGSSDKSGDAAIYNKKKQRRTMTSTEGSGKGQN